ncbi:MAG: hypothetical protein ACK44A_17795, partial [Roseateles sp.]
MATTGLNLTVAPVIAEDCDKTAEGYLGLYDFSRPDNISLLDALALPQRCLGSPAGLLTKSGSSSSLLVTDQGVGVLSLHTKGSTGLISRLALIDLLTLELVGSVPRDRSEGVPLDSALELRFTRPLNRFSDEDLREYLSLQRDADSGQAPEQVPFAIERSAD